MSLHTLEQRLRAVESRLSDVEGGYGRTLYRLQRDATGLKLDVRKLLTHFNLSASTDADIDAELDEQ